MAELKECPFCGGKAAIHSHFNGGTGNSWDVVTCTKCGVSQPVTKYYSREEAKSAWNRRPSPSTAPLTLDELRKMDGEPVYSPQCRWGIVGFRKVGTDEHGGYDRKYTVSFSYGWEWLDDVLRIGPVYRAKPEEDAQ